MIKSTGSINEVKEKVVSLKEKDVKVTLDLGRNKIVSFCGKLSGVYPALFTVTPHDKSFLGKTSYSYQEFLCGKVKIKEIT
jgi:uncharacterized protein Veg